MQIFPINQFCFDKIPIKTVSINAKVSILANTNQLAAGGNFIHYIFHPLIIPTYILHIKNFAVNTAPYS